MTSHALWHLGALWEFKLHSEQTDGALCVAEQLLPKGFAPPVHTHTREDEAWMVIDGAVRFFLGDDDHVANKGDWVYGPRDAKHTFLVESSTARVLTLITPGAVEQFFHETGAPAGALELPPPPDGPPDVEALMSAMQTYGVEFVAPPPHL